MLKQNIMQDEVKPGEATIFYSFPPPKLCESTFLGASSVESFYFTLFGRKRLQAAPEAAEKALSNDDR
jgi:hypothetical protein